MWGLSTTYVSSSIIAGSISYYYKPKCVFVLLNENGSHAARCWPQKLFIFLHKAPESELSHIYHIINMNIQEHV